MIRHTFPGSIRSVAERGFKFTAVTSRLGRDGHVLVPSGVDLAEYRRAPVILWQHVTSSPVARCTSTGLADGEVRGSAEFAPAGTSAAVDEAFGCVKSGVVGAVSVGFDIVDAEPLDPKKGSRGGLCIKRSNLLEISIVSVPADMGALITERAHRSSAMNKHLGRLEELVDTAARHCDDLGRALDRGDELGADRAHVKLGRCIRDCQRCFRDIHADAALADLQANQFSHNSGGGLSKGTSDGRSADYDYRQRQLRVLELSPGAEPTSAAERAADVAALMPRVPATGQSLVDWCHDMREHLQSDALARSRCLVRHGLYSRAERQADLARLTRRD
jgi:HK97 family phage prohead protease